MGNLKHRLDKLDRETAPLDRRGLIRVPPRIIIPGGPEPEWSWVDPTAPRIIIPSRDERYPPDGTEASPRQA